MAFEPISEISKPIMEVDLEEVFLDETILALKDRYPEILELEVTPEQFVKASVFTEEGASEDIFINAVTGEKLGEVHGQTPFFAFVTNFHRSLFLKSTGRFFVGLVSMLLCLIAITGVFLLAQRQGGFRRWFSKVQERDFRQRYHVRLGRLFLIPILIIAGTGVYLSAEKFSLLPDSKLEFEDSRADNSTWTQETDFLESQPLSEVRKVIFPFSDDPEDMYEIALRDRQVLVDQYTGKATSMSLYPWVKLASAWSMKWHTGQGSILWSMILLIASLSIVFFIYSGLSMSVKRLRRPRVLKVGANALDAEYVVLVGSETRNTYRFANAFQKALTEVGKKTHLAELNAYTSYPKASHVVVLTSTYGDGDPPSSANKFTELVKRTQPENDLNYAVVGFGSLRYPGFCQFAVELDTLLDTLPNFHRLMPLVKINEQSEVAFKTWLREWNTETEMNTELNLEKGEKLKEPQPFEIIEHRGPNIDDTVMIRLRSKKRLKFASGDLLNIYPPGDPSPRKYSIARIGDDIVLSVKKHIHGKCSTYLTESKTGDTVLAFLEANAKFHFPEKAPSVWMVANGTGIAPFLGMLGKENSSHSSLSWGLRKKRSIELYQDFLPDYGSENTENRLSFNVALSQGKTKRYVQDSLYDQRDLVAKTLKEGGVFMLCGSVKMQQSVVEMLNHITTTQLGKPLSDFEKKGQLLMDCY